MSAPVPLTPALLALGRAMGETGAAFEADPNPRTRAAHSLATRRFVVACHGHRPAEVRYLMEIYEGFNDEVEQRFQRAHPAHRREDRVGD